MLFVCPYGRNFDFQSSLSDLCAYFAGWVAHRHQLRMAICPDYMQAGGPKWRNWQLVANTPTLMVCGVMMEPDGERVQ